MCAFKEPIMKLFYSILLCAMITLLSTACVTRTTSIDHVYHGEPAAKNYGGEPSREILGTKRIWIWQDEFRNPK